MIIIAPITISDIAKKSKVSVATVSRVLNDSDKVKEQTKEKVLKAIKELNYAPSDIARSLSRNITNTIGVVVPDINNPFFGQVIKGISSVTDKNDLYMLLCDTDENEQKEMKFIEMLKRQRIRGLIITPTADNDKFNAKYLSILENLNVPVVLLDRDVKYSKFDGVFLDSISGTYDAIECFIKEGHRKIAIISGPLSSKPGRDRLRGYKKSLSMNGIEIDERYIFYGDFKLKSGYELTKQILKMDDPPTAIFVSNNMMNLGCIKALTEANVKIPEDMALIGFDEIELLSIMNMYISVVSRPTAQMGEVAMQILLDRLNEKNVDNHDTKRIILLPKLILRGSERKIK
ncbi:LacI family transcriptional regulator [Vallitalea longa]|uniref:LacI family transcriptional regulator n=1 Tax=Vallitalea longa TaxID=2936439 RepID=A0A9W5YA86_9FIRM|nr:LacI family DNA-binding transcriptional regulator [Vallitalea longa]GKX28254.1 LacI family transcriptional regulator [Vallitalea longa]